MSIQLVCFDLDDTLIQNIHSVRLLSILHSQEAPLLSIEELEDEGKLNWIEADRQKAKLLEGLATEVVYDGFCMMMRPLDNVAETVCRLRQQGITCLLLTAGPIQVAEVARERWGFDAAIGSLYETRDGLFTGEITEHIGEAGKLHYLRAYVDERGIPLNACMAIGDGDSDVELFEACAASIAVNAAPRVKDRASYAVDTTNLFDILPIIAAIRANMTE